MYFLKLISITFLLQSCLYERVESDKGGFVTSDDAEGISIAAFSQTLYPVVKQNCGGCHLPGGPTSLYFAGNDLNEAHKVMKGLVNFDSFFSSQAYANIVSEHNKTSWVLSTEELSEKFLFELGQWAKITSDQRLEGTFSKSAGTYGAGTDVTRQVKEPRNGKRLEFDFSSDFPGETVIIKVGAYFSQITPEGVITRLIEFQDVEIETTFPLDIGYVQFGVNGRFEIGSHSSTVNVISPPRGFLARDTDGDNRPNSLDQAILQSGEDPNTVEVSIKIGRMQRY